MRGKALLEALVQLSQSRGISVRREPMTRGTSAGGLCVLKGVKTVFVDERANVDAQIEILARVLRREAIPDVESLDPALRTVLARAEKGRGAMVAVTSSGGAASPDATLPTSGEGQG